MRTMKIYIVIASYNYEDNSLDNTAIIGIFRHRSKADKICEKFREKQELLANAPEPISPSSTYDRRNPTDEWINYFDDHANWEEHQEYDSCEVVENELNGER